MTDLFHYEADTVEVEGRDLPGLKARFLIDHVHDGEVVLDVGCGGGKMLRTLAAHHPGAVLLGCDLKPLTRPEPDFEFRLVSDPEGRLPFDDASVDVALLFDVLEHVEAPAPVLDEVARVLRPGGRLIAFVPVEGEPISWYRLFRALLGRDLYVETKDHIQAFRHTDVDELVGRRFTIDDRRYAYHFIGQLMDAGFCALLRVPFVRRRFWSDSPYHNRSDEPRSGVSRLVAGVLVGANRVAWAESRALARVRATSAGVLLEARRK